MTFFLFRSTFFCEKHPSWNVSKIPHLLAHFHQHLMWFSDTVDLRRLQDCKTWFSLGKGSEHRNRHNGCTLDTRNLHSCNNSFRKKKTFLSFRQILVDVLCVCAPPNFNSSPLKIDGVEGRSFPFRKVTFQGQTVKLCFHVERAGF